MSLLMDEKKYLNLFKNTILGYSKNLQKQICDLLEEKRMITFDEQTNLFDSKTTIFFRSKSELQTIISETTTNKDFVQFYEYWEFVKLYKYSIPLFYEGDLKDIFKQLQPTEVKRFDITSIVCPEYTLSTSTKDTIPTIYTENEKYFVKFVTQKSYLVPETAEYIDYRYPIVIYFDNLNKILEIRYDAMKYNTTIDYSTYWSYIEDCLEWIKKKLEVNLYHSDYADIVNIINKQEEGNVKIFKQMMELSSGGSAELTASEDRDYILPFIGEIKELIDENEVLFNEAKDIKEILLQYLSDKEATASYPYIYVKWLKPSEYHSFVIKITFDYFNNNYTLLQHITGNCKNLRMERMNDAIEYLCRSGSFYKGEGI